MPPPKDPKKRAEYIRKQSLAHLGKKASDETRRSLAEFVIFQSNNKV
jgi:hypothetical protein